MRDGLDALAGSDANLLDALASSDANWLDALVLAANANEPLGGLAHDAIGLGLVVAAAVTLFSAYRVVALDTIGTNVVAIAVLYAMWTGRGLFVDVSLVLAIIGFVSTIAVARFVTEGDIIE